MVAPRYEFAFDLAVARAAARHWAAAGRPKRRVDNAIARGRYASLDTPERLARRANRLIGQLSDVTTRRGIDPAAGAAGVIAPGDVTDRMLERVIGASRDFVFIDFLERAMHASRAVARIVTQLGGGRLQYGTGFMVSPQLMLTNHHVLPTATDAARSRAEFDYQRDVDGGMQAPSSHELRPARFFLNDKALDFALVAVAPEGGRRALRDFGWCPLIKEEGKIVIGEPVNIVQHPLGEPKQITLRENRLLVLQGRHAHYEADTEPGSSGSPVFNNQWEVVALHHSGVPKTNARGELLATDGSVWRSGDDPARLAWVANEGIRVSRLVAFIERARLAAAQAPLRSELLAARPAPRVERADVIATRPVRGHTPGGAPGVAAVTGGIAQAASIESVQPDPDDPQYLRRAGFDRRKLGFAVPFPKLGAAQRAAAFVLPGLRGERRYELRYHHYSVVFNAQRRLAFFAATNLDPTAAVHFGRDSADEWFYDPRVPQDLQAGEELYSGNPLDRGHLVRRADAAWGEHEREAKLANDDTFHFTNCSPQHEITNRGLVRQAPPGLRLWGRLEEHVSRQSRRNARAIAILSGPVFAGNDSRYRGVQLPKSFWKLLVYANDAGKPAAAAFVLTQAALIEDLEEEFELGDYRTVQLHVSELATRTGLQFGRVAGWDVLAQARVVEAATRGTAPAGRILLDNLDDVQL